jgi:hypothetical protein
MNRTKMSELWAQFPVSGVAFILLVIILSPCGHVYAPFEVSFYLSRCHHIKTESV